MSDVTSTDLNNEIPEPVTDAIVNDNPQDSDFTNDISEEEKCYYKNKFKDLNEIKHAKLHCTACDRHLGCGGRNENRMQAHPLLRTLVCHICHKFYNSGEFEKGDDGSELYCRWCGQGGQVYCCSACPHVFCAKCIRRNLGSAKIKEIETMDDWKCFKCSTDCLWDLRAICWALLRFCDIKKKLVDETEDPALKEKYQKFFLVDDSECCRDKKKRGSIGSKKKEEKKDVDNTAKKPAAVVPKMTPTIQVKKFASIYAKEIEKNKVIDKMKRPASPIKNKTILKSPIAVGTYPKFYDSAGTTQPPMKKTKFQMQRPVFIQNPFKLPDQKKQPMNTYNRVPLLRPNLSMSVPIQHVSFNGFNSSIMNDNINLSLDSLTQGLDLAAMASTSTNNSGDMQTENDDVVCTPDFPMEPLCEVAEDTNDDDVQCITPGPISTSKARGPPPLVPRFPHSLPDLSPENIIQMTDNDVTVNAATGGLKFRIDPQTLSSNKMYRLPDGRIFAINANPTMPGGYSATIVAVTETSTAKITPRGTTFAAKVNTVSAVTTPPLIKSNNRKVANKRNITYKKQTPKVTQETDSTENRDIDVVVPVEWYRYNLIDAVDALEYSLSRLKRLKKETTTMFLRSRSLEEMRSLHRTLERLLNTSSTRFQEIRGNLNRGFKEYILKKNHENASEDDDDDDDVEILPNPDSDDPIYIDENSLDSNHRSNNDIHDDQEIHLVSDHNDSKEKGNNETCSSNTDSLNESSESDKSKGQKIKSTNSQENDHKSSTCDDTEKRKSNDKGHSHNNDLCSSSKYINIDNKTMHENKDLLDIQENLDFDGNDDVVITKTCDSGEVIANDKDILHYDFEKTEKELKDKRINQNILEALLEDKNDEDVKEQIQKVQCVDTRQENTTILSN